MLARRIAERSAETGEHYITRSREEYRLMLERATGGGAVLAATTFAKFAILALGLSAFTQQRRLLRQTGLVLLALGDIVHAAHHALGTAILSLWIRPVIYFPLLTDRLLSVKDIVC